MLIDIFKIMRLFVLLLSFIIIQSCATQKYEIVYNHGIANNPKIAKLNEILIKSAEVPTNSEEYMSLIKKAAKLKEEIYLEKNAIPKVSKAELEFTGLSASSFDVIGNVKKIMETEIFCNITKDSILQPMSRVNKKKTYYFKDNKLIQITEDMGIPGISSKTEILYDRKNRYLGEKMINQDGVKYMEIKVVSSTKDSVETVCISYAFSRVNQNRVSLKYDKKGRLLLKKTYGKNLYNKTFETYKRDDNGLCSDIIWKSIPGKTSRKLLKYTQFDGHNNWTQRVELYEDSKSRVMVRERKIIYEN